MRYRFIIYLLCMHLVVAAQKKTIGDKLPSVRFTPLMKEDKKAYDFTRSKAKLLIAEVWNHQCGSCLTAMLRLAALKEKFGPDVDVVLLTTDKEEKVVDFYQRFPKLAALKLPVMNRDKAWQQWFPCNSNPHCVWIGADKKVKAITGFEYVTEKNIGYLLQNGSINLPVKNDFIGFDKTVPMLLPKYNQQVYYLSSFSGTVTGRSNTGIEQDSTSFRLYVTNSSLPLLYKYAYRKQLNLSIYGAGAQIKFMLTDSNLLHADEYAHKPSFCYELILPRKNGITKQSLINQMQKDLDQFFGFESKIEKQKQQCIIIYPLDTISTTEKRHVRNTESGSVVTGTTLNSLPIMVESRFRNIRAFYDGNPLQKVSYSIKNDYTSLDELKNDLQKTKIGIRMEERELPVLIITEKKDRL